MITLRIAGVPEPYNLPWHVAMEQGRFAEAGIDLQWSTVHEGTGRMCQMLRDNELDMAVLVTEGAVRDILNGGPHRIVSTFVESALPWGVHVPAASPLHRPEDLKGVPFAISRYNSGSHLMSLAYAKANGWEPTEKDFIVVNDLPGAVMRLQEPEPAVFLWEKFITAAHVHAGTLRRVDEYRASWPSFVVVARNEVLKEHGRSVQRMLKVVRYQTRGLMEKKSAPELVAQQYGMTVEDAKVWFGGVRWSLDGKVDVKNLSAVYDMLIRSGMFEKQFPETELMAVLFNGCPKP